jgi:MSHA biogenesis protein MshJ
MKRRWQALAKRIDALSLRERLMLLAACVAMIGFLAHAMVFKPMLARQAALRSQINAQRDSVAGIDSALAQTMLANALDPDLALRERLSGAKSDTALLLKSLRALQDGLVAPERIAPLIETILRANGRLQLLQLKTLPVSGLAGPAPAVDAPPATPVPPTPASSTPASSASAPAAPKPSELLYRHGVELVVRGNYLDMVDYMRALESVPTQLFWAKAQLEVEDYPNARLTLSLYTLSLDRKWMTL